MVKFLTVLITLFLAASAGAAKIRFITLKDRDHVVVKNQRLNCQVTRGTFYCIEINGFPRLSFLSTTEGGEADKGEFFVFRNGVAGDQTQILFEGSRRK